MKRKILITGPVDGAERYAAAAEGAGWEPVVLQLLEVRPREVDVDALLAEPFDWICVTSTNALFVIEAARERIAELPCAVVGASSAQRLNDLGFRVEVGPCRSARSLAEKLLPHLAPGARVLWPRGNRSDQLAVLLREHGAEVADPVVYHTLPIELGAPLPVTDAVFFASPSAVARFLEVVTDLTPRTGIALGGTTLDSVHDSSAAIFESAVTLLEPTPAALRSTLEALPAS